MDLGRDSMEYDLFYEKKDCDVFTIGEVLSEEYADVYFNETVEKLKEMNDKEMEVIKELKQVYFR